MWIITKERGQRATVTHERDLDPFFKTHPELVRGQCDDHNCAMRTAAALNVAYATTKTETQLKLHS